MADWFARTLVVCAACVLAGLPARSLADSLSSDELRLLHQREFAADQGKLFMQAMELARKLGKEASAEGLEAILQAGNGYRLHDYLYGFSFATLPTYPPAIESLVVRHYGNAEFQSRFLSAIAQGRAKYQSEALFKLLLETLRKLVDGTQELFREDRIHTAVKAIVNTNLPGIEQTLLDLCPKLSDAQRLHPLSSANTNHGIVISFLAQRKYSPVVPYLAARFDQSLASLNGGAAFFISVMDGIDRPVAIKTASRHFDRLTREPDSYAVRIETVWTFGFLRRQGVHFPVQALAALLEGKGPNDELAQGIVSVLAAKPDKAAVETLVNRLGWLAKQPPDSPAAAAETALILANLAELRDQTLLDYARLREALPAKLSDRAVALHLKLIERRKEKQAVPDLIAYLAVESQSSEALRILIAFDSVDIWRAARAGLERHSRQGKLNPSWYRFQQSRLDEIIANPDKYFAEMTEKETTSALLRERAALDPLRNEANRARDSDIAAYVAKSQEYLEALQRLRSKYRDLPAAQGLTQDVGSGYMALAGHVRFAQKRPQQAIALYRKAQSAGAGSGRGDELPGAGAISDILIADLYQFDLRNAAKALEHYEYALKQLNEAETGSGGTEKIFAARLRKWVQHEVSYLAAGRTFSGTIERDEALAVIGFVLLGASDSGVAAGLDVRALSSGLGSPIDWSRIDREKLREKLEQLPASRITLLKTVTPLSLLPTDQSILRYLRKHDPSGYLSACILAAGYYVEQVLKQEDDKRGLEQMRAVLPGLFVDTSPRPNAYRLASARFLKDNGIVVQAAAADPRKSTPENTWKLFIASLQTGDLQTAYGCLTDNIRARWEPAFSKMPPEALRNAALSFSGFSMTMDMGTIREAIVTTGDRVGFIYFVKELGEWKIQEM